MIPSRAAAAIIPAVVLLAKVYQANDRLEKGPPLILVLVFFRCAVDGDNGAGQW